MVDCTSMFLWLNIMAMHGAKGSITGAREVIQGWRNAGTFLEIQTSSSRQPEASIGPNIDHEGGRVSVMARPLLWTLLLMHYLTLFFMLDGSMFSFPTRVLYFVVKSHTDTTPNRQKDAYLLGLPRSHDMNSDFYFFQLVRTIKGTSCFADHRSLNTFSTFDAQHWCYSEP